VPGVGFLREAVRRSLARGWPFSMLLMLIMLPTMPSRNSLAATERSRKGAKP
jgi:hypothetical protein